MPTIDVEYAEFMRLLEKPPEYIGGYPVKMSKKEQDELDDLLALVKSEVKLYDGQEGVLSIEIKDTNRPDLWSVEGLARALRGFFGLEKGPRRYEVDTPILDVNVAAQQENDESLLSTIRRMLAVRKQHPVFAQGKLTWMDCGTNAVAGYIRHDDQERILVLTNLSSRAQSVLLPDENNGLTILADLLGQESQIQKGVNGNVLLLEPYQYLWLPLQMGQ